MDHPFSINTRLENRGREPLVFHVLQGGRDGDTILEKLIMPFEYVDICPRSIFGRGGPETPVSAFVYLEGLANRRMWTPLDASEIMDNAKLFLTYNGIQMRVDSVAKKGNNVGRLRVIVGLKNAVKKMGNRVASPWKE